MRHHNSRDLFLAAGKMRGSRRSDLYLMALDVYEDTERTTSDFLAIRTMASIDVEWGGEQPVAHQAADAAT